MSDTFRLNPFTKKLERVKVKDSQVEVTSTFTGNLVGTATNQKAINERVDSLALNDSVVYISPTPPGDPTQYVFWLDTSGV